MACDSANEPVDHITRASTPANSATLPEPRTVPRGDELDHREARFRLCSFLGGFLKIVTLANPD
jgi:hypothetical protein